MENDFKNMFSHQVAPLETINSFPENDVRKLSDAERHSCEGPISEEELMEAVKSFQQGKTPGIDGIPTEVYQRFYEEVKKPLLSSFNDSYTMGYLSDSQKEGLISLLLQQEANGQYKDPTYFKTGGQ